MNCFKHTDVAAVAFCRTCGRPLCQACQRAVQGTIVCEEHMPQPMATPPPPVSVITSAGPSPGLAFVLGLIPGVGAVYNGQYAKGVVHVVILGLLISMLSSGAASGYEPLFSLLLAIFYFYMPFEAYHTASRRQLGQAVDEFSSILPMKAYRPGLPVGPVILMALGVLFLLTNLGYVEFRQVARYWPVLLIVLGAYMLYCRVTNIADPAREAHREQR